MVHTNESSSGEHWTKWTRIEEVEDEDSPGRKKYMQRWIESFLDPVEVAKPGRVDTLFEKLSTEAKSQGSAPWAPFDSEEDLELACLWELVISRWINY